MPYFVLHNSVTCFRVCIGVGESIWHDREYLPTLSDHKWKSWTPWAPVFDLMSYTNFFTSTSTGELSIRTLTHFDMIGLTVKRTRIEKT